MLGEHVVLQQHGLDANQVYLAFSNILLWNLTQTPQSFSSRGLLNAYLAQNRTPR